MNSQQISRITIEGFKSMKSCDISLSNINILIGSNGAGKSNFISVFKLLQNIIDKNLKVYIAQSGGANTFLFNGRKYTDKIAMEFFFGMNSYEFVLVPTDDDGFIFSHERFNYDGYFQNFSYVGGGTGESEWDRGAQNKLDSYIQPVLQDKKWRLYHFHDTGASARVKQTHKLSNNAELQFDAGNLAAFLYRLKIEYPTSYTQIVKNIRLIAPFFRDFYLESNSNDDIKLRWTQVGSDDIFNANQMSDGTLRFICLATLFLQPEELKPQTIIVDEPELGLHPFAITALSELIKKSSVKKQIIVSTQSVELLNEFAAEDVVVVDRNEDGTTFRRFTENELENWLRDDYSMGELWKKNILGGRP